MTATPPFSLDSESESASVPLWREVFMGWEWARLRMSPVYYGIGVPRGDRSPVITVPGFLGSDMYLTEFRWWLARLGYRAVPSGIGRNVDCLQRSGEKLLETVNKAFHQTGRPVHLIGHSLGGLLARSVAGMASDRIASVTTLGSPIRAIHAHPSVIGLSDLVRNGLQMRDGEELSDPDCFSGKCSCRVVSQVRIPLPASLPVRSIYTKTDGVVLWEVCVDENPANNIEVTATHCGLAFNASVFRHVARFLKQVSRQQAAQGTASRRSRDSDDDTALRIIA